MKLSNDQMECVRHSKRRLDDLILILDSQGITSIYEGKKMLKRLVEGSEWMDDIIKNCGGHDNIGGECYGNN